jgi:hypothetical protein
MFVCQKKNCIKYLDLKLSHHTNISRHEYLNKMVHGNQWATSTEISVATRILQSNINIWLQGRDGQNNICFTKKEYINSSNLHSLF